MGRIPGLANVIRGDNSLAQNNALLKSQLSDEFSTTAKQVRLIKMGRKSAPELFVEFMEVVNDKHQDDMVMNVKDSLNSLAPTEASKRPRENKVIKVYSTSQLQSMNQNILLC